MTRSAIFPVAWLRRLLHVLETCVGTRRGRVTLFVLAVAVYELEGIAVPISPGRDLITYLHYYLQLGTGRPVLLPTMLYREPVAPLLLGSSLDWGGRALAEALMALLYAGSIVAWSAAAAAFGRRASLFTAAALLVFPGYGILFHEFSSDAVFAAAFSGWALLVTRATVRPSVQRFAVVGLGVGMLTLVRPGNESLLLFALFPLLAGHSWRQRLGFCAAFLLSAGALLGSWAVYNGLRYDVYAVSRGGNAFVPFFRTFVADHIVSPKNGPASRELARAVERYLLPLQPYRVYNITLREFFARGSIRMHEDLIQLSDRVWGWDSNYTKLREVAVEAVESHPSAYARGVASTIWDELWYPLFGKAAAGPAATGGPNRSSPKQQTVQIRGRTLPRPTEGEPIPASHYTNNTSTPDGRIHDVWTSATAHHVVFPNPLEQQRYDELLADTARLRSSLTGHGGNATLGLRLNQASKWYPRLVLWLIAGLIAIVIRRPRHARLALALTFAALAVIVFTALGFFTVTEFAIPVGPAFVLLAAAGLFGERKTTTGANRLWTGPSASLSA